MASISAFEAKTHFGSILDRVAEGEEIVITRYDKPVARIVPEGRESLSAVREAVARLRDLRAKIMKRRNFKTLTDAEVRAAVNQGRR